ncbi:MAG: hypothetical protein PHI12_13920 [Dehalococcoidales bacterium]|nr:hypothetical protein [Candidatus Thermoplasmatota archaeon]MDD5511887.1 hypothetical protein [Dehalococcoidales bacterium]
METNSYVQGEIEFAYDCWNNERDDCIQAWDALQEVLGDDVHLECAVLDAKYKRILSDSPSSQAEFEGESHEYETLLKELRKWEKLYSHLFRLIDIDVTELRIETGDTTTFQKIPANIDPDG